MIIQSTIDTLKAMRFSAMAGELEKQLNDPATYNSLGFEERLGLLIDAEWNRRQSNKLAKGIRDACFSAPDASVEGIEYHPDRKLDKAQMLRFATCKYIEEGRHIILQFAPHGGHWCVCQRPPGGAQRPPSLRYFDRLNNNNVMLRCPLHNSVG